MAKYISKLCVLGLMLVFQAKAFAQTITNQPQSIIINNASTATFTVVAGGATNLSYQWQFNGSKLTDGGNITGSTSPALTLEDVSSNQAGTYTVVVNNSVTSSGAVLTIVPGTIVTFTFSGLLPDAPGSNVQVQLFDHDKPATVENFIHYVRSGAYTNMFFERCATNYVLQGGDYGASNRTSTSSPITGWYIGSRFTTATNQPNPPYPPQIDSEYNVGPLIANSFGTIAMALVTGDQDSANSAFFFNLADNSSLLDGYYGDFTVFGRILNGTNVLQYFNTLNTGKGIVTDSTFSDDGTNSQPFPTLPVDYLGTNNAANANLVFCDFTFVTTPPVDSTPPTVAITNPAPNTLLTNALAGTASDDVGLALVACVLTPQATNGQYPYNPNSYADYSNAVPETNFADGTTNWSLSLYPGVYNVSVWAQDGAGNLSPTNQQLITNTAVLISGNGTVAFPSASLSNANPVGYPMQPGSNYEVQAIPATNQTFVSWSDGAYASTFTNTSFVYEGGVYTATFISNTVGGIAFTSPTDTAMLSNALFNITGIISNSILTPPVTVTCQIFTNTASNYAVTLPQSTTTSTTNWSVGVTNYLPTGSYTIVALAADSSGSNTLITENFSFTADTNLPTVAITSPASNAVLFLGGPLLLQGTANDSIVPVTAVTCTMIALTNADGTVPYYGSFSADAVGTTNWSLDLAALGSIPPGSYTLEVQSQDAAGNSSPAASLPLTISAILTNGDGTVTLKQGTITKAVPIGYPLQYDVVYGLQATAAAGSTFVNWNYYGVIPTNQEINITYTGGLLTATFIPTNVPKGTKGISFVYPTADAKLTTNSFLLKGKIAPIVGSAQIACQISSRSTDLVIGPPLMASGTTTWSVAVSNLPPDIYLVQAVATNASGFSTVISEEFAVLAFKGVAGTYSGLFICTNAPLSRTNSGFFSITMGDSGVFSAKLLFPAYPAAAPNYSFPPNGILTYGYSSFHGSPLNMVLNLDLTNGTDTLTGTVSSTTWSSQLICYRAATKLSANTTPAPGKYIISLDPEDWFNTNGYASLAVGGNGVLTLSGALPDGATFSQSARIGTNGIWPFYAIPAGYKTNGMLLGWETNLALGGSSGQLYWYKAPNIGAYYTSGVNVTVNSAGTNYVPPAAGDYSIVFEEGTNILLATNDLTEAHTGGQFKPTPADPADKLAISLSANGVLTGHFASTNESKPLQFKGAYFGQFQDLSGFILDGDGTTGYFLLEPPESQ